MTNEEVKQLIDIYWTNEGYVFPFNFEHRIEPISSAVIYTMIRHFKSTSVLEIGTWSGGSSCLIMSALQKNGQEFQYTASELLDEKRSETEKNVFDKCNDIPTMIGDITKNLDQVPDEIDFLLHDTNHDRQTTEWIVKHIFPRLKKDALVIFHDWAVYDDWIGKSGMWPETEYLLELHHKGELPLKKLYWNYKNPGMEELGVFTYEKT